ncbi:alpha-ribazole-5'-phosphatase domain protein [Acinetobacter sp. 809848]|nr:alpha-ribazole-5'-phosphatase domain protein [Acinetobacter sp. 809848]
MDYQHTDADLCEHLYKRVQALHKKLKILAETNVQKNLAVLSHRIRNLIKI